MNHFGAKKETIEERNDGRKRVREREEVREGKKSADKRLVFLQRRLYEII